MSQGLSEHFEVDTNEVAKLRPDLLASIRLATEFFEEKLGELPSDTEWRFNLLTWTLPGGDRNTIRVLFRQEHPEDRGGFVARVDFTPWQLQDKPSREIGILQLMNQVLQARSKISKQRVERFLIESMELPDG